MLDLLWDGTNTSTLNKGFLILSPPFSLYIPSLLWDAWNPSERYEFIHAQLSIWQSTAATADQQQAVTMLLSSLEKYTND